MRRYCALVGATLAICIAGDRLMSARAQEPTPAPPKAACDSCQPPAEKIREITERIRKDLDLRDEAWRMQDALDDANWADTLELSQIDKDLEQIRRQDLFHENATLERLRDVLAARDRAVRARIAGRHAGIRAARQRVVELERQMSKSHDERLAAEDELAKCNSGCQIVPKRDSKRWPYYTAAGAGLIGLLGTTGTFEALFGDFPGQPVLMMPPATLPNDTATTPAPTPAPAPTPDAIDLLMGVYVVQTCVCELDPGGHDASIRLCQSARQFRLTRTGPNTVRLDGTAPLLTADFVLDANSRTIDANAIGMVGSNSAVVQYSGTFGAGSPNFTLLLGYAIAGSTTRYRVVAVKQ